MNEYVGKKYGRLTIISIFDKKIGKNNNNKKYALCRCECGKEKDIYLYHLTKGKIQSCGCFLSEITSKRNTTHGLRHSRIYSIYKNMINRCYNKNVKAYSRYGGRGIIVFDNWRNSFQEFYSWSIKNGYADNLKIERIDNDGNYEPSNCEWVTDIEQCHNRGVKINNKSGITGVRFDKKYNKWRAYITINYNQIYLGQFNNIENAIIARKEAEKKYWNKT